MYKWSFHFNAIIEQAGLSELELSCRSFTWSNNKVNSVFEKLDRVLVSMDWEVHYPLSTVKAMPRALSDHVPLLLNTGNSNSNNRSFKFELGRFLREDLYSEVSKI